MNNEEKNLLNTLDRVIIPEQFTEREARVIENLIKKSIIKKARHNGQTVLVRNDKFI